MATITLTANTNVSALTLDNDDTIDLAGFQLNMDVQPTVTGIQVTSPGTAGTVVFPVACVIPTWDFFAGTNGSSGMIATLPANCEIGDITGGSSTDARGIGENLGVIRGNVFGGVGLRAHGVVTNSWRIHGDVNGGGAQARGVSTNNRTIFGNSNGGTGPNADGVLDNLGTVVGQAIPGTNTTAYGIRNQCGVCGGAIGSNVSGSATAILQNSGVIVGAVKNGTVSNAVGFWQGGVLFLNGPLLEVALPQSVATLYSLFGPVNPLATIDPGTTVIELTEGGGAAFQLVGGGGLVY